MNFVQKLTVLHRGSGNLGICYTFLAWLLAEIRLEMQGVLLGAAVNVVCKVL